MLAAEPNCMGKFAAISLILVTLTGCRGTAPEGANRPRSDRLALPQRYYVTEAALRYMLDKHSHQPAERDVYSAYVVDCEEFQAKLVVALRDSAPPLKQDFLVSANDTGDELFDSSTGKHFKVWRVVIVDMGAKAARAYVFWNSGSRSLGSGSCTLALRRRDGHWEVKSEQQGCVP